MAGKDTLVSGSEAVRERIPVWYESVDLGGWRLLGVPGAGAHSARREPQRLATIIVLRPRHGGARGYLLRLGKARRSALRPPKPQRSGTPGSKRHGRIQ